MQGLRLRYRDRVVQSEEAPASGDSDRQREIGFATKEVAANFGASRRWDWRARMAAPVELVRFSARGVLGREK